MTAHVTRTIQVDPLSLNPAVAFFVCSLQPSKSSAYDCFGDPDAHLAIKERTPSGWEDLIDVPGDSFYLPKLGYLSTGKAVIAYRDYASASAPSPIKLLVQP